MAARDIIQAAAGAAGATEAVYVEDVFSTYLYTGNGSTQTITNGIDLSTKGGMVWCKSRSNAYSHALVDTTRGASSVLCSDRTDSPFSYPDISSFNSTGYTIGQDYSAWFNSSSKTYASWTFRKQAKFFDVVTYTGTGSARTLAHSLGVTPGMIIVKRTDAAGNWQVYHNGLTSAANSIQLNLTAAQASATTVWNSTAPTSTVFSVGTDATVNASGGTYVAYLFAASNSGGFGASGTDSVVACGSFTTDGSGNVGTVNLGWEPQYLLFKVTDLTSSWFVYDTMRGWTASGAGFGLNPNNSTAELDYSGGTPYLIPTSTGFSGTGSFFGANRKVIYLAIRRGPMKTPTDATKVFSPNATSATVGTAITTGFPIDLQLLSQTGFSNKVSVDRLRGVSTNTTESSVNLFINRTDAEDTTPRALQWNNTGFSVATSWSGVSSIYYNFRRAPGFFDVVCYTGTGSATTVAHNLGVVPEIAIIRCRNYDNGFGWYVYTTNTGSSNALFLSKDWSSTNLGTWVTPSSSSLSIANNDNTTGPYNFVAYLFATCPGVSKVFSFTGNGSSQTIDCGFTSGARFVLIKRTDSTGDWWTYDSARGIVSAADPALRLNSTAAEVTSADAIDPASSGFIVNQETTCNVNVNNATYIGLAIA